MRFLVCLTAFFLISSAAWGAPLRVALLLEHDEPSTWTDLLRKGLQNASAVSDIHTEVVIAPPGIDQRAIFREAAANHDLVLVASDNLHEALRDNAANFRRVMFGSIDAGIRAPNIMSVTFADEQAAFLAGAAAAMLASRHGAPVIGWLSGVDTPAMRTLFNGYSEGAHLAAPGVRVIQAVVGSFTDPGLAARKTEWLIDSGAKVVALAAGAGNPVAMAKARARNIEIIELDAPTNPPALGVISKAVDKAIQEIITAAATGRFRGREIIKYDLSNRGVNFEAGASCASPDIRRRLSELRGEIEKGAIRINSLRQRTLCDCLE